jgi:iron complex transport system permease protein
LLVLKKLAGVKMTKTTEQKLFLLVIVLLLAAFLFSLTVGRYKLDWFNILEVIKLRITDQSIPDHLTSDDIVFWSVRLPRLLMALFVGSALAVSGTVFQGLFRNPLVSPDILGVSAGASFGAGMAILLIGNSAFAIQVSAFAFGLVAVALAYQLARHCRTDTITVLVLAGVIVSALFTAGLSFLKYVADPYEELPALVFWTMGGFSTIAWKDVAMTVPVVLIGILILYLLRWKLDIMALGDEEALSLGVKVNNMRLIYIYHTNPGGAAVKHSQKSRQPSEISAITNTRRNSNNRSFRQSADHTGQSPLHPSNNDHHRGLPQQTAVFQKTVNTCHPYII